MIPVKSRAPGATQAFQRPVWEASRIGFPAVSRSPGFVTLAALVVYLLFRFSMLQDFIAYRFRFNTRYHYVCVPILLLAVAGGVDLDSWQNALGGAEEWEIGKGSGAKPLLEGQREGIL